MLVTDALLDVEWVMAAGKYCPDAATQLAACELHANQLVAGLSTAIKGLTHLHLTVRLLFHNQSRCLSTVNSAYDEDSSSYKYQEGTCLIHTEGNIPKDLHPVACPVQLEVVSLRVFEILSVAVPGLQHLSLLGHCGGGALGVFGQVCPQLHSVGVEASSVSVEALRDLHTQVPCLTHCRLFKRGSRGNNLHTFTATLFASLGPCTSFTCLELDFGDRVEICCGEEDWELLPHGILDLRSTCALQGLRGAAKLLTTLRSLYVVESPYKHLVDLLRRAPRLQALSVQAKEFMKLDVGLLYNDDGSQAHDLEARQQQLSTMDMSCPSFLFKAGGDDVAAVLTWLHPLPSQRLTIQLCSLGASPLQFLAEVAFVFPYISTLELVDVSLDPGQHLPTAGLSEDCLIQVTLCKCLKNLFLRVHVTLTTSGLSDLCVNLPLLEELKVFPCKGLDRKELKQNLCLVRPNIRLVYLNDK